MGIASLLSTARAGGLLMLKPISVSTFLMSTISVHAYHHHAAAHPVHTRPQSAEDKINSQIIRDAAYRRSHDEDDVDEHVVPLTECSHFATFTPRTGPVHHWCAYRCDA